MNDLLKSKNYTRAPIVEAVIDFRVSVLVSPAEQEKAVDRLSKIYSRTEPLQAFDVNIDTTGGMIGFRQRSEGFQLKTLDQTNIVLVQPNGFAVSRLAPYPGWDSHSDAAKIAWSEWKRSVGHNEVTRIGVRYINRIDVPKESISIKDYLNFYPHEPDVAEGPMVGYLVQITRPTRLTHWNTSITSTLVLPSPLLGYVSLLLDIDVYREAEIPSKESDLWMVTNEARLVKNDIFERCITDETRKLIS